MSSMDPYAVPNEDRVLTGTDLFGGTRALEKYKKNGKKATSERAELLGLFLQRLNPSRAKMKLPPLTAGRLSRIFEGVPTSDLYALDSYCRDAENRGFGYSKEFWIRTKPKKISPT